ncbi:hypothetical protein CAPTEDRAFT_161793, partial [Capitella teleta]
MASQQQGRGGGCKKQENVHSLHDLFRIIGDQLTLSDLRTLTTLYKPFLGEDFSRRVRDGFSFLLALEKSSLVDETNLSEVLRVLKCTTRHDLLHLVSLTKKCSVTSDPVEEYLESSARHNTIVAFKRKRDAGDALPSPSLPSPPKASSSGVPSQGLRLLSNVTTSCDPNPPRAKRSKRLQEKSLRHSAENNEHPLLLNEIRKKVTCDIRLRVRAEYCDHQTALQGNINSNRAELIERQFERFHQANTILKSRDLGSIICDIKFSELTYLDAFWRDYINGALLEALKGVFLTESLKQAVGHEAIKLLVNVDEDDYEAGRLTLLSNLTD